MPELELQHLEEKLENFFQIHHKVRTENNALRNKLALLTHENSILLDRKRKAINILRKIITQLKEELSCRKK